MFKESLPLALAPRLVTLSVPRRGSPCTNTSPGTSSRYSSGLAKYSALMSLAGGRPRVRLVQCGGIGW
jgi:hypothetical protein